MKFLTALATAAILSFGASAGSAQGLVDKGFVAGWNIMSDPAMGNGCLIQTIYEDLSVVRIGYDADNKRGYFVVFNKAWGKITKGKTYGITFDLDGQTFDANATGFRMDHVPGAGVFFDDPEFVRAIANRKVLTVFDPTGKKIMAVDLKGTAKAIEYARKCEAGTDF